MAFPITVDMYLDSSESDDEYLYDGLYDFNDEEHKKLINAAKEGDLEFMKSMLPEPSKYPDFDLFHIAAENGNMELLKWMYINGLKYLKYSFDLLSEDQQKELIS